MGQMSDVVSHSISPGGDDDDEFLDNPYIDRTESVKKKLRELGYDKEMNAEDFNKYASILSDKSLLLKSYLHTDFSMAKLMQKQINEALAKAEKKRVKKQGFQISTCESEVDESVIPEIKSDGDDVPEVPAQVGKKSSRDKEEDDMEIGVFFLPEEPDSDEDIMGNKLDHELDELRGDPYDELKTKIRVKLIISETSKSQLAKNFKRIISPIINLTFPSAAKFGLFHIALGIGPWKLEWNNSSLCIPRCITGRYSMICSDLSEIHTLDHLNTVRSAIADVIIKWNTTIMYTQKGGNLKKNQGNCQEFVDEMLLRIGINTNNFPDTLKEYVKTLRVKGTAEMTFQMNTSFMVLFHMQKSSVTFSTHEELDTFVNNLFKIDIDFEKSFPSEFHMLKSFDRAFWMRYMKMKARINIERDEEEMDKIVKLYGPKSCPFKDPIETSILKFQPNKI